MAIGTLAAIGIGAAGIGSALSAKSQSKAAGKAADTSMAVAQQNNALARDIYGQNKQALAPYMQAGIPATQALNSFYGLTPPPAQQQLPAQQPNALAQWQGYNPDSTGGVFGMSNGQFTVNDTTFGGPFGAMGGGVGGGAPWYAASNTRPTQGPYDMSAAQPAGINGADAFKNYIANSDYAFQFGEGANRVNSGYAGAGTLQSGAAMKAMEDYRQNLQSGYRNEWASGVANQQGVGLAGASALAGVGQNYVNTISNNNNNAGTAAANAALVKGQSNPFANALGMIGGGILGMGK